MKIIRVLVYEGDEKFMKSFLRIRAVKGTMIVPNGKIIETFVQPYTPEDAGYSSSGLEGE